MGWSTGSSIFDEIMTVLEKNVPDFQSRVDIYKELITIFEDYDCDTLYECHKSGDEAFDEAWEELNEQDDEDEYDDED